MCASVCTQDVFSFGSLVTLRALSKCTSLTPQYLVGPLLGGVSSPSSFFNASTIPQVEFSSLGPFRFVLGFMPTRTQLQNILQSLRDLFPSAGLLDWKNFQFNPVLAKCGWFFFKQWKTCENSCFPISPSATDLKGLFNFRHTEESRGGVAWLDRASSGLFPGEHLSFCLLALGAFLLWVGSLHA